MAFYESEKGVRLVVSRKQVIVILVRIYGGKGGEGTTFTNCRKKKSSPRISSENKGETVQSFIQYRSRKRGKKGYRPL